MSLDLHARAVDLIVDHHGHHRHLFCDVEEPSGGGRGTVLIAHGFKGYKDYGMFPRLARVVASAGWSSVRFNFAHSGMTRNQETFERPDLFALDTWNAQVRDLNALVAAVRAGELSAVSPGAPVVLFGHSRGGLASILAAGRGLEVDGVFSLAAPADPCRLSDEHVAQLSEGRGVEVTSDRTGQTLLIGPPFLHEITGDPDAHDVLAMAEAIQAPLVVAHGSDDATVSLADARLIAGRAGVEPLIIPGGNHVMNVVNPLDPTGTPSPQLQEVEEHLLRLLGALDAGGGG
ncbi:MAG: alpha/beta fold hydrolase [Planctomycetota bacterium]|nr:alpha/beta fold hydrolase [Planctomycetota bacterium]